MENQDDKLLADLGVPYVGMPATYVIGSDQYGGMSWSRVSPTRHRVTFSGTTAVISRTSAPAAATAPTTCSAASTAT